MADLPEKSRVAIRKPLESRCRSERPKKKRRALSDCKQTRLATLRMFTDDPIWVVVGAERTVRMILAWNTVTAAAKLAMAPDKRQLGAGVEWIGILALVGIAIVAVPKNKLIRARQAIVQCLKGELSFGDYRAMVGLLEHLKAISRLTADIINALYRPHGKEGESKHGPSTIVKPDKLMVDKLNEWLEVIMRGRGRDVLVEDV